MRTVAIVQARLGSTRLPGKVLQDIAGQTMLARVVRRLERSTTLDAVAVATTDSPADEPILQECRKLGIEAYRGSEQDVLDRYHQAARACRAGTLVRITSDCPLIDPLVVDRVVAAFLRERPDYASNVLERTYPRGLDTEVMSFSTLERAWREASEPYQRVHVTPYIYQHPELFRLLSVTAGSLSPGEALEGCPAAGSGALMAQTSAPAEQRWTVDTAEDLAFVSAVYRELDDLAGWEEVLDLLERRPELREINRRVRQKALHDG